MSEAQKRFVMALAFIVVIFSLYVLLFDQRTVTGNVTRNSASASWLIFWTAFPFVLLIVLFAVVTMIERNRSGLLQRESIKRSSSRNRISSRSRSARSRSRRR